MSRDALLISSSRLSMPSTAPPQYQQHNLHHHLPLRHHPLSPLSTSNPSSAHRTPPRRLSILDTTWPYNIQQQQQNRPSPPSSVGRHTSSPTMLLSKYHQHKDEETPAFFNLEKVVQQYGEQPELLGLILSSKVEEDRRRAEEAKLKQKEIDYLIQQHQGEVDHDHQHRPSSRTHSRDSWRSVTAAAAVAFGGSSNNGALENSNQLKSFSADAETRWGGSNQDDGMALEILPRIQYPPSIRQASAASTTSGWRDHHDQQQASSDLYPRPHYISRPLPIDQRRRSVNNIDMLLSHSPRSTNSSLPPIISSPTPYITKINKHHHQDDSESYPPPASSSASSPSSLLDSEGDADVAIPPPPTSVMNAAKRYHPYLPPHQQLIPSIDSHFSNRPPLSVDKLPIPPVSAQHRLQCSSARRRRRREVQAISTIVETRDFPYNDDYLWKNNGNTVHKKSGYRSIYYKCSNSAKGCPVNKTVTFKEHGEYLIKYRGQHLDECNQIKRIVDM